MNVQEQIQAIKSKIEKETGLKVSVKRAGLKSAMRGYATFTARKVKGQFVEWSIEFARKMLKEFEQEEPTPTFCNTYQFHFYFGMGVYND